MRFEPLAALALTLIAASANAQEAGLQIHELPLAHHQKSARMAVWYPAASGRPERYAENPIFQGVDARLNGEIAQGAFPVVLFSHGMGGTDRAQAWLGAALAERGAIVVMVNHPNSTWGDMTMAEGVKHWTRAADLSSALDWLAADPTLSAHIDPSRIMAAGFSYGGWTALLLGGVTGNLAGLAATCAREGAAMEACEMLMSEKVNLPAQDPALWGADYGDPRVRQVVAIDPGFIWGLTAQNTKAALADILLIGLGDAQSQMSATDVTASGLTALLPQAEVQHLAPAFHFTAMPLCTENGALILAEEQDDPVCTDPEGTDRAQVHRAIIAQIAARLGL